MRSRHIRRHESEVEAGALTDIMFFLLFFFLIIATTTTINAIKIQEPQATASDVIEKDLATVTIKSDTTYWVGLKKVAVDSLYPAIKAEMKKHKDNVLVLRMDRSVPVDFMVKVLEIGIKEKIKVSLETEKIR